MKKNSYQGVHSKSYLKKLLLGLKIAILIIATSVSTVFASSASDPSDNGITDIATVIELQQSTVSGTVTDASTGDAMPGVNVVVKGATDFNTNVAIEIRYAEILLNYAEACLELGDIVTATTYINIIRNRAGLPNFTGDITKALRHERKVELYAEGFRWYDIRRWKIMPQVFVPCGTGIDIIETYNAATGQRTTTWRHISSQVANKWVNSMWWIPIQTDELKRAPQLKQNPGY